MARISAHGSIIGTVDYLTKSKRYMSDGVILKNAGFGWKLAGKVKPEYTPAQAYEISAASFAKRLGANPAAARYRRELHELAGLDKRWKLHAAVSMMPDDPDGVWSEACDGYCDNVHADIGEIVELCRWYKLALGEREELAA